MFHSDLYMLSRWDCCSWSVWVSERHSMPNFSCFILHRMVDHLYLVEGLFAPLILRVPIFRLAPPFCDMPRPPLRWRGLMAGRSLFRSIILFHGGVVFVVFGGGVSHVGDWVGVGIFCLHSCVPCHGGCVRGWCRFQPQFSSVLSSSNIKLYRAMIIQRWGGKELQFLFPNSHVIVYTLFIHV
jgi:hypothetical protein